jgi:hypothetical protein
MNPMLLLPSLDVTDTPIEILHTVLLGIVKYHFNSSIKLLSVDQKKLLKGMSNLHLF